MVKCPRCKVAKWCHVLDTSATRTLLVHDVTDRDFQTQNSRAYARVFAILKRRFLSFFVSFFVSFVFFSVTRPLMLLDFFFSVSSHPASFRTFLLLALSYFSPDLSSSHTLLRLLDLPSSRPLLLLPGSVFFSHSRSSPRSVFFSPSPASPRIYIFPSPSSASLWIFLLLALSCFSPDLSSHRPRLLLPESIFSSPSPASLWICLLLDLSWFSPDLSTSRPVLLLPGSVLSSTSSASLRIYLLLALCCFSRICFLLALSCFSSGLSSPHPLSFPTPFSFLGLTGLKAPTIKQTNSSSFQPRLFFFTILVFLCYLCCETD